MDVLHCVKTFIDLQRHLKGVMAMQEEIQNDFLTHLLGYKETTFTSPRYYETREDIEACFAAFERAASAHSIPKEKWTKRILDLMDMNQIDGLNPSLQGKYEVIKDHLCSQAKMTEEQWQVRFALAHFDAVKGPRELGQGLDQAARHWLKPSRRSAEDVVRLVALHRFVSLLPSTASEWVLQHRPKDMEQAICLAELFLGTRSEEFYREMDKEVTGEQHRGESETETGSETSGTSGIRISQIISLREEENHMPSVTSDKDFSSTLYQSGSFNVKLDELRQISLDGRETGNKPERLALVRQGPIEDDDHSTAAESVSLSIQAGAKELNAPRQNVVFSPRGQLPSVTISKKLLAKSTSIKLKKRSSTGANGTTAHIKGQPGKPGSRCQEKYGERDKEVKKQYRGESSSGTSSYTVIRQPVSLKMNDHIPSMIAPEKERSSSKSCQSVSFNLKREELEEKEETENEQDRLASVKREPMEDDYCGTEAVSEPPSIQAAAKESSALGQNVFSPSGLSSATTSTGPPADKPETTQVKTLSVCENETDAAIKDHMCSACGESFAKLSLLRIHRNTCNPPLFACHICEATFTSKIQLGRHRRIHSKVHTCPYCDKPFRDTHALGIHLRTHNKVHSCPHCDLLFPDGLALRAHLRTHSRERPYQCPDCGDLFMRGQHLQEHQNVHSDQRPFVCPECGKTFSRSGGLRVHRQSHSNLRPFICTLCGKTFKLRGSLRKHQRYVHEGKRGGAKI